MKKILVLNGARNLVIANANENGERAKAMNPTQDGWKGQVLNFSFYHSANAKRELCKPIFNILKDCRKLADLTQTGNQFVALVTDEEYNLIVETGKKDFL